jgi:hypothetical protein
MDRRTQLKQELNKLKDNLSLAETEETWQTISRNVERLSVVTDANAAEFADVVVDTLRECTKHLVRSLQSERTILSGCTFDLLTTAVVSLEGAFEPLITSYFPPLLSLCARPSKLVVSRAKATAFAIIHHTYSPIILRLLRESVSSKSTTLRQVVSEATLECLTNFSPRDLAKGSQIRELESIIKATARDASAEVRSISRHLFEAYETLLPERIDGYVLFPI